MIYAEYEVSRTPDAKQRPQDPAQSQHQVQPPYAREELPGTPSAGKKDDAAKQLRTLSSAFDKAAKSGAVHRATADRKKSRLALRLAHAK